MSSGLIKIVAAVVLIAHGIGHVLGLWAAIGKSMTETQSSRSWLLSPVLGGTIPQIIMFILFLAALIGFIGAGLGIFDWLVPADRWLDWAVWASFLSIAALVLFPRGFPTLFPNVIGALLVDVVVLVFMWRQHWPSALFE